MPKKTISQLRKSVWKKYSLMVRLEETDDEGYGLCVSCLGEGKETRLHYKQAHACHFVAKSLGLKVYFERKNIHFGCVGCNLFKHGNLAAYAVWMKGEYGAEIFDELMTLRNEQIGGLAARAFLEEVLEETNERLKSLEHKI